MKLISSVITGMPSLLQSNSSLLFDSNWPLSKELPVPNQILNEEITMKESKKSNQTKKGQKCKKLAWKCQHSNKVHYAKGYTTLRKRKYESEIEDNY